MKNFTSQHEHSRRNIFSPFLGCKFLLLKKTYTIILAMIISLIFFSCAKINNEGIENKISPSSAESSETKGIYFYGIEASWPYYGTVKELVDRADLIFIGRITDITFEVLDFTKGIAADDSTPKDRRYLHSFYQLEILETYKGNTENVSCFRLLGGVEGYNEEAQYNEMQRGKAKHRGTGIPTYFDRSYGYAIGETYLIALVSFEDSHPGAQPSVLNLDQSLYCLSNPDVKTRTYDRPLPFGAEDIVKAFGEDKLAEFMAKYR